MSTSLTQSLFLFIKQKTTSLIMVCDVYLKFRSKHTVEVEMGY